MKMIDIRYIYYAFIVYRERRQIYPIIQYNTYIFYS